MTMMMMMMTTMMMMMMMMTTMMLILTTEAAWVPAAAIVHSSLDSETEASQVGVWGLGYGFEVWVWGLGVWGVFGFGVWGLRDVQCLRLRRRISAPLFPQD